MRSNKKIFLSKSVSFAIEMVRASLRHIPTDFCLERMWMQTNMELDIFINEKGGMRYVSFAILIGLDTWVKAYCYLTGTNGEWKSGNIRIYLLGQTPYCTENTPSWHFHCQLNTKGQLDVQPIQEE